jgi:hypothetical protein
MKFGVRHAVAVGIAMLCGAAVFVMWRLGAAEEVLASIAAGGFVGGLSAAFGAGCGACGCKRKRGDVM